MNNHESMLAITREPYKLLVALSDHRVSSEWAWQAGDRALFDLRASPLDTEDLAARLPDMTRAMLARLETWRRGLGEVAR